jgi:hypothetical protein
MGIPHAIDRFVGHGHDIGHVGIHLRRRRRVGGRPRGGGGGGGGGGG